MKILYQNPILIIADTGVTTGGKHYPLKKIASWRSCSERSWGKDVVFIDLVLTSYNVLDIISFCGFGPETVRLGCVPREDWDLYLEGKLSLENDVDMREITRSVITAIEALNLMLSHKS